LYKWLKSKGFKVFLTKEPGGTEAGLKIRDILLGGEKEINIYTELFLYLADRAENLTKNVEPNLMEDKIVISDRHFDSTVAYQMAGRGISKEEIQMFKELKIFSLMEPDITFLLDVAPEIVKDRIKEPDRIERENIDFHHRVRSAYLDIARSAPDRVILIDARGTIEKIHGEIKKEISNLIGEDLNES
jgi:dTMP kinase